MNTDKTNKPGCETVRSDGPEFDAVPGSATSEMWELAWKTGSVEGGCGRRTREEVEYAVRRALFEEWDSITITRKSPKSPNATEMSHAEKDKKKL